jgi:hypothetical protein
LSLILGVLALGIAPARVLDVISDSLAQAQLAVSPGPAGLVLSHPAP